MTNAQVSSTSSLTRADEAAIDKACSLIAPNWPLDRLIAVNPLWEYREQSIENASARVAALTGAKSTKSASYFNEQYTQGKISQASLVAAAERYQNSMSVEDLVYALDDKTPPIWLSLAEIADLERDHHKMRWQDEIVHQISQFCGDFTQHETSSFNGLYRSWLAFSKVDYGLSLLMGEQKLRQQFNQLPSDIYALFALAKSTLHLDSTQLELYAHKLLLSINGWASYLAWQRWEANLEAKQNDYLKELLAIVLAWDLVVWRQLEQNHDKNDFIQLEKAWHNQLKDTSDLFESHLKHVTTLWIWNHAAELEYQASLHQTLLQAVEAKTAPALLQVACCIDVRSETLRNALEAQSEGIQTIGFAGFFGLPISYQPVGSQIKRPQLPGLLAPSISATGKQKDKLKLHKIRKMSHWKKWAGSPFSAFTMVESVGWFYAFKLLKDNFFPQKNESLIDQFSHHDEWQLEQNGQSLTLDERAALAAAILNGMGLTDNFAPTVLLLGHGSETRNNLHAAGLDCGACGGQTGEVNVRVLSYLLNDNLVRVQLVSKGISIPQETHFIAGLHNTTTDEIICFSDLNNEKLESYLKQASMQTRRARVNKQVSAMTSMNDIALEQEQLEKTKNWSEIRPEWGLANNAAFIIAPRSRTRCVDLKGRAFLHDYQWQNDTQFTLLEQIMTAPMLVTHWINMQYHFSVTDNSFFGSGNKLLHNAVGQHIGVFEGNGGDLRIGLSLQSLHDG
ncbi:MAG TPA: DUF2309 domain-containing protein, partial [Methylophaga aminisulfidivorans]|nr:DUF2309 domain-containing protein [Methylophaga aminisulfidivorans]